MERKIEVHEQTDGSAFVVPSRLHLGGSVEDMSRVAAAASESV